jgi:hypothetical protein
MDQLNQDLVAASANQADPKWPGVLSTDLQLVANTANGLSGLEPPGDAYRAFGSSLDAAVAKIVDGTQLLSKSITERDENAGAQAFLALTQGRAMLDAALASLPKE